MVQCLKHGGEQAHVNHGLSLLVGASRQIANCANDRNLDRERLVIDQRNQASQQRPIHERLDVVLRPVDDVAERPAAVDEDIVVRVLD